MNLTKFLALESLILMGVFGCSSMHENVVKNIHEGDPSSKVVELFGQPDTFAPSQRIQGATAWYYNKGADTCGFTIKDDKVAAMACGPNPNHVGIGRAIGTVLQGAGQGLQNGNKNSTHCTTTGGSGLYNTNCD